MYLRPDDLAVALRAHLSLVMPASYAVLGLAEVGLELAEHDAVLDLVARGDVLEEVHVPVVVQLQNCVQDIHKKLIIFDKKSTG